VSRLLLQISYGPVQSFIAASRKTADLKAGSELLSEVGKGGARRLRELGKLIFPCDEDHEAANILLAVIDGDPRTAAESVRSGMLSDLSREFEREIDDSRISQFVDRNVARKQLSSFLEFFAVWTPMPNDADYATARRRAGFLMAARKSTRTFGPAPSEAGRFKSPLDPASDGVLHTDGSRVCKEAITRLKLKPREHLDAISLFKRIKGLNCSSGLRFPSTRSVCVNAVAHEVAKNLDNYPALVAHLGTEEEEAVRRILEAFEDDENQFSPERGRAIKNGLKKLRIRRYYAVLHADGDSMGEHLDCLADGSDGMLKHVAFSKSLASKFTERVGPTVAKHYGFLVYAGGDDVLALCPVETAIELADDLRRLFLAAVDSGNQVAPTLTVGLAICHEEEDLQSAIQFARDMERLGKGRPGKNALAMGVKPRSGGAFEYVDSWMADPAPELTKWREWLDENHERARFPRTLPYEVRRLADELRGMETPEGLIEHELVRIASRKTLQNQRVAVIPKEFAEVRDSEDLDRFAKMLLLAHFLTRDPEERNV